LLNQIQIENDRLAKARKLLLDDTIDANDYKTIKAECENKLLSLEAKLTGFGKTSFDFEGCLNKALHNLSRLQITYNEGNVEAKRGIIGSIYPEKVCFDGTAYRTARVNDVAHLIYLINNKLYAKKIGQNLIFQACPIR